MKTSRRWLRLAARLIAALVLIVIVIGVAFMVSPRPGAMVVRYLFKRDEDNLKVMLAKYRQPTVAMIADQIYRPNDADAKLDVYFPQSTSAGQKLPTLIWTHGGAWLSGDKANQSEYYQTIALEGFTVVSVNYSLAPDANYPKPVEQVNDAIGYVVANAERLHADPERIFLAGDSAGAQITSQIATLTTSTDNALQLGIKPSIKPTQLRGVILHCGFYDLNKFVQSAELTPVRFLRFGMSTMIWSYFGVRQPDEYTLRKMSALHNATAAFPPTFISGGNGDPLTEGYSRPFAERLSSLGVEVTTLFFAPDHRPSLGHEYQFRLDLDDAKTALNRSVAFMRDHSK